MVQNTAHLIKEYSRTNHRGQSRHTQQEAGYIAAFTSLYKVDQKSVAHSSGSIYTELCSSITSGVASERKEISLYKLENRLLLADAGYPSKKLFPKIAHAKGYYLIKLKSGSALEVVSYNQYNADGTVTEFKNVKT